MLIFGLIPREHPMVHLQESESRISTTQSAPLHVSLLVVLAIGLAGSVWMAATPFAIGIGVVLVVLLARNAPIRSSFEIDASTRTLVETKKTLFGTHTATVPPTEPLEVIIETTSGGAAPERYALRVRYRDQDIEWAGGISDRAEADRLKEKILRFRQTEPEPSDEPVYLTLPEEEPAIQHKVRTLCHHFVAHHSFRVADDFEKHDLSALRIALGLSLETELVCHIASDGDHAGIWISPDGIFFAPDSPAVEGPIPRGCSWTELADTAIQAGDDGHAVRIGPEGQLALNPDIDKHEAITLLEALRQVHPPTSNHPNSTES